jgi:hypothetical protein
LLRGFRWQFDQNVSRLVRLELCQQRPRLLHGEALHALGDISRVPIFQLVTHNLTVAGTGKRTHQIGESVKLQAHEKGEVLV